MGNIFESIYFEYRELSGKVAVAVSGGKDSMCLLDILSGFPNRNFELLAINIEHGIRGENSKRDSKFVSDYCLEKGIKLISESVDSISYAKQNKVSLETAARLLRYQCFERLLASGEADYIALAHHSDDLCETMLMRIFRGTGLSGLVGIQNRDNYIRPLLTLTRQDIEKYISEHNIPFVTDETNLDSDYTRNFIRNELFPAIEGRWKDYRKSLLRLSKTAKEYTDYFDKISPNPVLEDGVAILNIGELLELDNPVKKHSIRKAVNLLCSGVDFEEVNLNDVLDLMTQKNGACVHLANGLRAYKEYDKLVFALDFEKNQESIPFKTGEFTFLGKVWEIAPRITEKLRFDITKIPNGSVIRTRANGDTFTRFGGITTSLGDYYTNKKIPKRLRDEYPVIAIGNQILVTPIEIADSVKSDGKNDYTLRLREDKK